MLALGVLVLSSPTGYLLTWLVGALFIAIGVCLRPRLPRISPDSEPVTSAPALEAVVSRVASAVGIKPPVRIVARDLDMGVFYQRVGLRREPVLSIGLPLWFSLSAQQRVAALAEACLVSRKRNGLVIESALWALDLWRGALLESGPLSHRWTSHTMMARELGAAVYAPPTLYDSVGMVGRVLGRGLGLPILGIERTLIRLTRDTGYGDADSSMGVIDQVAGPKAVAGLHMLLDAPGRILAPVQSAVVRGESPMTIRASVVSRAPEDLSRDASVQLAEADSKRIDLELERHYSRALRSLSLLVD